MMNGCKEVCVVLNENELRYVVSCGFALLINIPDASLPTYTHFSKEEIIIFSKKIRDIMDKNEIEL